MTNVVEYKAINEKHLSIGEDVAKKVVEALSGGLLDITGYAVRDYSYNQEERLDVKLNDKSSLTIIFTRTK